MNTPTSIIRISSLLLAILPLTHVNAQRLQQKLDRGVVAVNRSGSTIRSVTSTSGQNSLISWRKLAQEPEGTTYNVYKRKSGTTDYTKVNSKPLATTCLSTTLTSGYEYAVTAISPDGVEGEKSKPFAYKTQAYPNVWFDFNYDDKVISRNDYRTKFVWPMDLDGDGEYDAVVADRLFAGASTGEDDAENMADNTATTSHKIQAYRLDGTLLWTVDMGPNVNICGGQNDMVVAWDINCDGRCEVIIRSSDGTRFWDKQNNTWGKYVGGSENPDVDGDGVVDYRSHATRVPPFYVSVIDGETGAEIDYNELKYSEAKDGSDSYSRTGRANYMNFGYAAMEGHFCICYLDGIHPAVVMECTDRDNNKSHHTYVFTWNYDWTSGKATNWHHSATWSRNDKRPWAAEFHQLRVADVNGDGCDEMVQGGYNVNPLKGWFSSPGIGHGDRYVLSDIDPDRPGLEAFAIQQSALLGQLIYDPATGEHIKEWYLPSVYDVGRGTCMDVDASHKGYELFSHADDYIYDCKGEKTSYTRSGCGIKQIFEGVWWNGSLQREELSSPGGSGWGTNLMITQVLNKARLVEFSQESSWATHAANGTRPAFMGDIIGDWREEVILAKQGDSECRGLVGYTTNMPTSYSIYCLQQDPHYRGDCTTRGYYQHPNTSFYLGGGMPLPPLPPAYTADLRWKGAANMQSGFATFDLSKTAAYQQGKSLMFDIAGDNASEIKLSTALNPTAIYLINPKGHDYKFRYAGTGSSSDITTGSGMLIKSQQGQALFNGNLGHTGKNIVSEGMLAVNGTIAGPVELRARGTLSGSVTLQDTITFEGALNYEGCRLMPTDENGKPTTIVSKKSMVIPGNVYIEVVATPLKSESGKVYVNGDLTFNGTNFITINLQGQDAARYVIAECTGTLTCDITKLNTRGLEGINYDFAVEGKKLVLIINETRLPATDIVWSGNESAVWDYKAKNFTQDNGGSSQTSTPFVANDEVVFTDQAAKKTITLNEMMVTNGVTFKSGKYVLQGEGGISGEGGVTVKKDANVTLNMKYSDYTGKTIVDGGTLTVPNFYDGGQKSALGATTATKGNLQLMNGGTLVLSKDNMGTDRQIVVGGDSQSSNTAGSGSATSNDTVTIRIAQSSSSLSLKGAVSGTGYLVKDGAGQLNFTYGGTNSFAGLIVKKGIVAQGAWNATFGKVGSPMVLAGGEVHQIDVNSTSTVPTFNHVVTVADGTTNKIVGSSRGRINGSFKGSGKLTIVSKYVRCDIGATFKDFEGTLTADGSQWRLMSSVTDMSKTKLVVAAGANIGHFEGGSADAATVTTKLGSLSGTATDGVLGGSTWQVGFLNDDTSFSGLLKCSRFTKVGTGRLTLKTVGHTAPMFVSAGILELQSTSTTAFTSSAINVQNGGTLLGTGLTRGVTVANGGTLSGGLANATTGSIRIGNNLTLQAGATVLVRLGATSGNTTITANAAIKHNGDTILISIPKGRRLNVDDEITVFNSGFKSADGEFFVKCVDENGFNYNFDASTLNTDGKLRVRSIATSVSAPTVPPFTSDLQSGTPLYDLNGQRIKLNGRRIKQTPGQVILRRSAKGRSQGENGKKYLCH